MSFRIGLSTASVYPESTAHAFAYAARLGFSAIEVMVGLDPTSMSAEALTELSDHHRVPISSIHAPCLIFQRRVWGTEPWVKLQRSAELARAVGAEVVVVHPPFRWQREYAAGFVAGIAQLEAETGIAFAVENMYPWRASGKRRSSPPMKMYVPGHDPSREPYANATIDLSHAASARQDPVAMARRLGPRLRHVHLTDGTANGHDQHFVPGRGRVGADRFMAHLVESGFTGEVVVEITTRKLESLDEREADLVESLEFARRWQSS